MNLNLIDAVFPPCVVTESFVYKVAPVFVSMVIEGKPSESKETVTRELKVVVECVDVSQPWRLNFVSLVLESGN